MASLFFYIPLRVIRCLDWFDIVAVRLFSFGRGGPVFGGGPKNLEAAFGRRQKKVLFIAGHLYGD